MNDKLRRAREVDNKPLVRGVRYSDTHSNGYTHQGMGSGGRKTRQIKIRKGK